MSNLTPKSLDKDESTHSLMLLKKGTARTLKNQNWNPAKPARMALGAHIIKEKLQLSDEETVEAILESPYLQFLLAETIYP